MKIKYLITIVCIASIVLIIFIFLNNTAVHKFILQESIKKDFSFIDKETCISEISKTLNQTPMKTGSGVLSHTYFFSKYGIKYSLCISSLSDTDAVDYASVTVFYPNDKNFTFALIN